MEHLYRMCIDLPHEGDVYAHVTVHARTIEADVDAERHARPCRVARTTIETRLSLSFSEVPLDIS